MFKFSVLGGTNVQGKFKPEQKNTYTTILGDHKIDLSEADLSGDMPIRITVCVFVGNAKVIVRPGTQIDVGGVVLIGNKKTSVDPETELTGVPVRVRFNCILGNLTVTSQD